MNVFDLDLPALGEFIAQENQPRFRSAQIWKAIYRDLATRWQEVSTLPTSLRETLETSFTLTPLERRDELHSQDGETRKYLFALSDGRLIESVIMDYRDRTTLCISTQAGCAMGCVFCATGRMGFLRNLTKGEIVAQVVQLARILKEDGKQVTNIVLMGMGEPFHNYDNTLQALDQLNDSQGMQIGARRFTLSTVGLVPMIERFTREKNQYNLAVSLHAADDETRDALIPVNKRYPIAALLDACRLYTEQSGRRITFEWALIANENDFEETALKLSRLLKGMLCHVNLIPLNPIGNQTFRPSDRERVNAFRAVLEQNGIPATVRLRRGIDIMAGCGQLATRSGKPSLPHPV